MPYSIRKLILIGGAMLILFAAVPVSAQYYWMSPGCNDCATYEFYKPKFSDDDRFGFFTSVWYLSARIKASDAVNLVIEVPTSHIAWAARIEGNKETGVGNPYFGIEAATGRSRGSDRLWGRIGIRPPVVANDDPRAAEFGLIATWNRLEAFMPNSWTLAAGVAGKSLWARNLEGEIGFQTVLLIPTSDRGDTELFIDYSLSLWYAPHRLAVGGGLAGRLWATAEDANLGERTVHQLGLAANYTVGRFRPGIQLRLPLDDQFENLIDFVYGVHVTYALR